MSTDNDPINLNGRPNSAIHLVIIRSPDPDPDARAMVVNPADSTAGCTSLLTSGGIVQSAIRNQCVECNIIDLASAQYGYSTLAHL